MSDLAQAFCRATLDAGVLRFGDFTLKSGRKSPYFFQLGEMFTNGTKLTELGDLYAAAVLQLKLEDEFDVVFGAAYKGIPIAIATATALTDRGIVKEVAFNRKEEKEHGEKGWLVGANLAQKRVLIVDDVVTDGAEKRHAARLVEEAGGTVRGVLIGLDRAESGFEMKDGLPQLDFSETGNSIPIYSVAHLNDVIELLRDSDEFSEQTVQAMLDYRESILVS